MKLYDEIVVITIAFFFAKKRDKFVGRAILLQCCNKFNDLREKIV